MNSEVGEVGRSIFSLF